MGGPGSPCSPSQDCQVDAPPAGLKEKRRRVMTRAGSLERTGKLRHGRLPAALSICLLNKQSQPGTLTWPFSGINSRLALKTHLPESGFAWDFKVISALPSSCVVKTSSSDLPVTAKHLTMSVRLTSEQNTLGSFPERLCVVHSWDEVRAHTHALQPLVSQLRPNHHEQMSIQLLACFPDRL